MSVQSIIQTLGHELRARRDAVWSLFWVSMAAIHAPALAEGWRGIISRGVSVGSLATGIALTAVMLFFAGKILRVSFLRVRLDRRAVIALVAIVAIMHVGVLQSDHDSDFVLEFTAALLATAAWGTYSIVRVALCRSRHRSAPQVRHGSTLRLLAHAGWIDAFTSHCRSTTYRSHLLRAPPA